MAFSKDVLFENQKRSRYQEGFIFLLEIFTLQIQQNISADNIFKLYCYFEKREIKAKVSHMKCNVFFS